MRQLSERALFPIETGSFAEHPFGSWQTRQAKRYDHVPTGRHVQNALNKCSLCS
jgi:hypothetical protein